ncbi:MAG: hypothetical protein M0Q21_05555 [Ignavibacteriaceae bacterium]|nr:hypothetical protein [Ignavibacteriaceae bacterium]
MKKLTIISLIFLSVQLFSQTQSLAYRMPFSECFQTQTDSLHSTKNLKPLLSIKTIFFQAIAGGGIGTLAALIGSELGDELFNDRHRGLAPSDEFMLGFFIGYSLGNALGVYWIGNMEEVQGSFGYTLFGSIAGMAIGISLTGQKGSAIPIFILPGVGGIIAFYLSAEEVVPTKTDVLIQIQNEKVQFGTPRIFLTRIDETSNKLRCNFELLRVNF